MNSNDTGLSLQDYLKALHNAAIISKNPNHPLYAQAPAAIQEAQDSISAMMARATQSDITTAGQTAAGLQMMTAPIPGLGAVIPALPVGVQNQIGAALVGLGQGASAGAVQAPQVDGQNVVQAANPTAFKAGEIGGAAASTTALVGGVERWGLWGCTRRDYRTARPTDG